MSSLAVVGVGGRTRQGRVAGIIAVLTATFRRDLGGQRLFGLPILLDVAYGAANLLVFLFISRTLHHSGQQAVGGSATYFDFVAVGLSFMIVAQVSCGQVASRVQKERSGGTLEVLAQAPISRMAVAVGTAAHPVMSGVLRSAVYLGLACSLLGVHSADAHWLGVFLILVLGAAATAGLAIALGAFAATFSHGSALTRAVIIGLGFLSGAYFPVAGLPAPLRQISAWLPTRLAIAGLRESIAGRAWLPTALLLAGSAAVLVPVSALLFAGAISRSIRKGGLSHG